MSKEDLDFGDIKISYEKKIDNKASLPSWKMFSGFLSYPILSYPILPYPILSYPILSYPVLSYPILSYPIPRHRTPRHCTPPQLPCATACHPMPFLVILSYMFFPSHPTSLCSTKSYLYLNFSTLSSPLLFSLFSPLFLLFSLPHTVMLFWTLGDSDGVLLLLLMPRLSFKADFLRNELRDKVCCGNISY